MASRSVYLELDPEVSLAPQSLSAAASGAAVDLQGCEAALIVLNNGAATTAATVQIQESADDSAWSAVADSDLIGVTGNSSGSLQTANSVKKVSYVGAQRYIRVNVLAGASAALVSAEVVRAHLRATAGQPA